MATPSTGKQDECKPERKEARQVVGTCYDARCRSNGDRLDKALVLLTGVEGLGRVS